MVSIFYSIRSKKAYVLNRLATLSRASVALASRDSRVRGFPWYHTSGSEKRQGQDGDGEGRYASKHGKLSCSAMRVVRLVDILLNYAYLLYTKDSTMSGPSAAIIF